MPLSFPQTGTGDTSTGWRPTGGAAPLQPPGGSQAGQFPGQNQDFLAKLARRRGLQKAIGQDQGGQGGQGGQAGGNMALPPGGQGAFPSRPGVTDMPGMPPPVSGFPPPGRPPTPVQPPAPAPPSSISQPAPSITPQQSLQPPPTVPQGHVQGSNSGLPRARREAMRNRGIAQGQGGW